MAAEHPRRGEPKGPGAFGPRHGKSHGATLRCEQKTCEVGLDSLHVFGSPNLFSDWYHEVSNVFCLLPHQAVHMAQT